MDAAAPAADVPLVDLLDRLLERGVALSGDLVISVAEVDLVRVGLRAVLQGVDEEPVLLSRTVRPGAARVTGSRTRPPASRAVPPRTDVATSRRGSLSSQGPPFAPRTSTTRLGLDRDDVERGLVQLVMTVVELVRELMERQALRRVDSGGLSESQVERLGVALMQLDERMEELKAQFGLTDEVLRPRVGVADVG